jgi:perosamine synthetase
VATRGFGEEEFDNLRRWLGANQDSRSEGMIAELQDLIAEDYPANRVLATNSCMGALHIALQTIGIGPGDEVIVDPIVVFGGMAAMYQNGVPVFSDVDPETFNLTPASVAERITPRTKAIICTHHFGNVCDMEGILEVAAEHGIPVIEDCAHSLFARRNGRYAGLFGHFAAFSFNHRKQLSTGQGGFLLINADEYVELSLDKGFGRVPARLNWNYAMPGLVAAIALAQWPRAAEYVKKDYELALLYEAAIDRCPWMTSQKIPDENWTSYHIWSATFTGDKFEVDYEEFMKTLRENGADYFLPSFMPYGAFGLRPSPAYRYPIFSEPRAYTLMCPTHCPHYEGTADYREGLCPTAEYLVPRLFNTVLSPVEDERVERYAEGLAKTISVFS